jgi:type I restriction enzyme S subunit
MPAVEDAIRRLPDGWRWARLGDHSTKIGSGLTPLGGQAAYVDAGIPLIRSQNVHMNRFVFDGLAFITAEQDRCMCESRVQAGDVLLNITGASIGRVCVVPENVTRANVNQHVCIIRTDDSIDPSFLSFYVSTSTFQRFIFDTQAGATRQALTKALIERFEVPLPPLSEQRRIAGVLREQMAAVDKARAAAQARLEAVDAMPAALLRKAFESRQAAQWPRRRFGEVLIPHKEIIHPGDRESGTAQFVGLEHLEPHTGRRLGSLVLDLAHLTGRKPTFRRGQIVYGYLRPYLNKVWIAEFDGCSSVDQFAYDVRTDLADVRFVAWFMRSPTYLRRSEIVTTTGQLPRIGTDEIAAVEIGLPSLREQRAIADQVDRDFAAHERIRSLLSEQQNAVDNLSAALLRRAFSGGL